MEESVLTSVVLPLSLFIIMLGVGLSLVVDDFKRVVLYPKAVAVGLFNQLLLLPLVALGLAILFNLTPAMAVGLMLIACCPGGVTSNLITYVSRGDTALSIPLTAISGSVVIFTIPLILIFSLEFFQFTGSTGPVEVPLGQTIGQIAGITALPITIGMLIRRFKPAIADRLDKPARIGSAVIFVVILLGVILANLDVLQEHFLDLSSVTIGLNLIMMLIGYGSARLLALKAPQALTISIESGIQNGTLAIVIATSILRQGDMAVPGGVYSLIMFVSGGLVMYYFGVRKPIDPEPSTAS